MKKKYIVRLSNKERKILNEIVRKFKGTSEKVRRAQILLKADVKGANWADSKIADAFDCRRQTVENIRQRLVTYGFEVTLNGKKRKDSPTPKLLNGEQEAKLIAMRLGDPPKGYGTWSLRILRDQLIELEVVETISHETVRQTLKKIILQKRKSNTG